MKRFFTLTTILNLLVFSACQKEEPDSGESEYYGGNCPTFYYYYYFQGIATDSSGVVLDNVQLAMDGPCYSRAITASNGYFFFRTCEMDSKWDYFFDDYITVSLMDTTDWSAIATTDFPSDLLIEDDTVVIDLQFPM